jgi:hypothetical protein
MNLHAPVAPADQQLLALINGYRVTQALYVISVLGVPELLANGPRRADDLAVATACDPDALHRVLRALAAFGVLREDAAGFALTALGDGLRADAPGSLKAWVEFVARPPVWNAWSRMLHTVRTGETAFRHLHGKDTWQFRADDPEESVAFDAAMSHGTRRLTAALLAGYDFTGLAHIADIGGGTGTLLAAILRRYPAAVGTLFELPHVAARSAEVAAQAGVAERFTAASGSFFDSVPSGADAYLLKHVVHDWNDDAALALLGNCRAAMGPAARLLLIERVVPDGSHDSEIALADLNMLVNAGGRERSEAEFRALLGRAGLQLARVIPLAAGHAVIEAVRAG